MNTQKRNRILKYAALLALVILLIYATVALFPLMTRLGDEAFRAQFKHWIDGLGFTGVLAMLGIQVLQIVLAVLPGEPIEVLSGVLYGTWGGLFLCLLGVLLGQLLVFVLVRKFGRPLVEVFFKKKQIEKFAFLQNSTRLDYVVFILYFIPGTPKDILCYLAGLTQIKLWRFLLISTLARIPSIVSSSFAGASLGQGNFTTSLWVFAGIGLLGLVGLAISSRVMKRLEKK